MASNPSHHPFVRSVAAALRRRCRVSEGAAILVAVSGGADSVALLRALAVLAPRRRWRLRLTVAHVHHHLRAAELAQGDALLVRDLARELNLPFHQADLDWATPSGNTEALARRARYDALASIAGEADCRFVATGHHGDDQLETLLMRLVRGSGVRGLSGMRWRRRLAQESEAVLIRPMLALDHAGAIAYLKAIDQTWREDHTNLDTTRWRARLRKEVLPALRELRPDVATRSTALADHLAEVDRLIIEQVIALEREARIDPLPGATCTLARSLLRDASPIVTSALLRRLLAEQGVPGDALGRRSLAPLHRAIRDSTGGQRVFQFAQSLVVSVTRDHVAIAHAREIHP